MDRGCIALEGLTQDVFNHHEERSALGLGLPLAIELLTTLKPVGITAESIHTQVLKRFKG